MNTKMLAPSFFLIGLLLSLETSFGDSNINQDCKIEERVRRVFRTVSIDTNSVITDTTKVQYMTIKEFKDRLGLHESRSTYNIINKYGFRGKYQFSPYMIRTFAKCSYRSYLLTPSIQEKAMDGAIAYYTWYIYHNNYNQYIGKEINGVEVTMETLLLGVHFSPTYLHKWLRSSGKDDGTDIHISIGNYMKKFEVREEEKYTILVCNR